MQEGIQRVESKEAHGQPVYEVRIDRERMKADPEIPEVMKEWLSRLPESLTFKDSITLIVGENGQGKSTFARAILGARGKVIRENNPKPNILFPHIDSEDPASKVRNSLVIQEADERTTFRGVLIDGTKIMSETRRWAEEQAAGPEWQRTENRDDGAYTHRLSSRQLFNQTIHDLKVDLIDSHRNRIPRVDVIFDEPEQGLSPQGQLNLPKSISELIEDGDTMLVPTNNLALFLSDLPRLDLNQPERGVYKPSDFDEVGQIIFPKNRE